METPQIDILAKVAEKKKSRAFGPDPEATKRAAQRDSANRRIERHLELMDCTYKTLLLEIKANHLRKMQTMDLLTFHLEQLKNCYEELDVLDGKVKVTNEEN